MRKVQLAIGESYHIFNRGVDKRVVFANTKDYERFILSMTLMNDEQDGLMIRWRNFKESHEDASLEEFLRLNLRKSLTNNLQLTTNNFHLLMLNPDK